MATEDVYGHGTCGCSTVDVYGHGMCLGSLHNVKWGQGCNCDLGFCAEGSQQPRACGKQNFGRNWTVRRQRARNIKNSSLSYIYIYIYSDTLICTYSDTYSKKRGRHVPHPAERVRTCRGCTVSVHTQIHIQKRGPACSPSSRESPHVPRLHCVRNLRLKFPHLLYQSPGRKLGSRLVEHLPRMPMHQP
jgi:hypothetical protein